MRTTRLLVALLLSTAQPPLDAGTERLHELARQSLSQIEGQLDVQGLHAPVEVVRDRWGVPHIYARNTDDLFFAQGYVQAQDRLWQMEMWRRFNAGRLAEIMGPEAFEHDRLMRLVQFQGPWDDEELNSYHPEGRRIFTAFVKGINAYIDGHRGNLPVEFKLTGITPEPWTLEDAVLRVPARSLTTARAELRLAMEVASVGADAVNRRPGTDPVIDLHIPRGLDLSLISRDALNAIEGTLPTVPFPRPPLLPQYQALAGATASLDLGAPEESPGSNNWAVSGRHTATGHVLLVNDPHRQVTNPSLRYLVHLNAPDWDVIGATEPAIPGVAIGHNGRIAWGLTIVGTDYDDVFVEEINPENPNEARWQGEWYPLRVVRDTIPVRGEAARAVERKYSRHGPIFFEDRANHRAYALRSTLQERGTAEYLGALRLNQASLAGHCRDFLEQQRYYLAPSENMVCGDADGNIAWHASALTPRRVGGWFGRLPVPGTGEYRWNGFRDDLPYEYNPERGWLGTANHNILPPGYHPPLFFKQTPYPRWDRLEQIFASLGEVRADDFARTLHDTSWPYIDAERALLEGWTSPDADVEWARRQLLDWDGRYEAASVAPSIHSAWRRHLDDEVLRPDGWAARGGVGSSALRVAAANASAGQRSRARAALEAALRELRVSLGETPAAWRWGRLHTSRFPHWLVSAYDLPPVERSGGGGTVAATGATYRQIVDFADLDASRATSTPGQSGQPGSPFYDNLREPWGRQEFFPLRYSREAVEEAAAFRLTLRPRP
jgi:penicillin G amidase